MSVMFDKAICLSVETHKFGDKRDAGTDKVEVDANKEYLKLTKSLFKSETYNKIVSMDGGTIAFLGKICFPSFFKRGVYMLPIIEQKKAEDFLREKQLERDTLADKFAYEEYPELSVNAAEDLKVLYNAKNYPPPDAVRAKFSMRWQYLSFTVPGQLENIDAELFKSEQEKHARMWAEAEEGVNQVLCEYTEKLFSHAVDMLTDKTDGKPKGFHDSMIQKWGEFFDTFKDRNITNNEELEALVAKTRNLLGNVNTKDLKDNATLRAQVKDTFDRARQELNNSIVTKKRKITFEEE